MKINVSESSLAISGRNFPAKLWNLANDAENKSVLWSPSGNGVIINQHTFEIELMSPEQDCKVFKTTNFTSFIRQLNLYGFRKVTHVPRVPNLHHFQNANFKRSQPELLVNMKRLTIINKAKILLGKKHHRTDSHQLKPYDRTPIPPRSWTFQHGDASPFYTNKGFPFYSFRGYPANIPHRIVSSPTTMLLHQEPNYIYPSNYYPPVTWQYCIMETDRTVSDQYSYSPYSYFPQNYSVSEPQNYIQTRAQTPNNRDDAFLERAFHMVDELQSLSDVSMVRVGSPVKAHHYSGLPEPSEAILYTSPVASKLDSPSSESFLVCD
ncbi:Heat shock factor protein 5 [Triplophysa tibetana]|uniref:Heat shock factor protein 5 n=1 Tax=Triplophysa tibetana TaxID=1572043 RepID=A0A5A9P549_9TELE|nr:Heat shock factor protein 5 [Triplophysa tibetana]